MTNKVIYKLKGHEKFPLREGWINKGLSVAKEKGTHIFLESQGPDMLGVGTNMVKSIRYIKTICWFCNKEQRPFYDIDWFLWQGKITFVTDSFSNSEYAAYKRKQ